MRRRTIAFLAVAASAGVTLVAAGAYLATAPGPTEGPGAVAVAGARADWSYVIPRGTGARLDRREPVRILPARIDAHVGEVIRIINRDNRGYLLGPFYVAAHRTLTQRFTSPGTFEGACVVHPSGEIVLEVRG